MARFDLTDFEWSAIEPLLPTKVRGVPRADDRKVLNGIFRRRTGAPWADIPARYGRTQPVSTASTGGAEQATERAFFKPCQLLTMATCR
ncbi:transposase [Aureimonas sp. OT7]|uniref:transposase n=1 Tax=Aureimonas sp. OT7 TaxID=2816454 RepID=UPI0017815410|nr:transposase [Aureimonas sp. OT7]QOG05537.1 transposase [Aureimonas sp. OT7]